MSERDTPREPMPTDPPDVPDDEREPWCLDFDGHLAAHEFCVDHQAAWCRLCDEGICPQCVHDPHCRECHSSLEEGHNWDCSYAD